MTSTERVMAAASGKAADRRPFTLTLSLYGARLGGFALEEYYTNPQCYLQGQTCVRQEIEPDILFAPFVLGFEARAFGCELSYSIKTPPYLKKPAFRDISQCKSLRLPDPSKDPGLRYIIESTRLLADTYSGKVPICAILTSPIDLPLTLLGTETWLETILFRESTADWIIERMETYFLDMAQRLFSAGADFLAIPMTLASPELIYPQFIQTHILPIISRIFKSVPLPIVFHHGGNPLARYLEYFKDVPNVLGFALDSRDNFTVARSCLGQSRLLLGNLDGPSLGIRTVQVDIERARKILRDNALDKFWIFSSSGADIPIPTPIETLKGIANLIRSGEGLTEPEIHEQR